MDKEQLAKALFMALYPYSDWDIFKGQALPGIVENDRQVEAILPIIAEKVKLTVKAERERIATEITSGYGELYKWFGKLFVDKKITHEEYNRFTQQITTEANRLVLECRIKEEGSNDN